MYYWEDSRVDWNKLFEAGCRAAKLYGRLTGKYPIWKEKYGTIRWEMECIWIEDRREVILFCKILKHICKKLPEVDALLVNDWLWSLDDASSVPEVHYYRGYFQAIIDKWRFEDDEN